MSLKPALPARALLLGLALSVLGVGAAACTPSDNGGVIQGNPNSPTTATPVTSPSTTVAHTSTSGGTLAPG